MHIPVPETGVESPEILHSEIWLLARRDTVLLYGTTSWYYR